jgi:ABC-type branched-subunit amino acid transport system substrate-binding protein
VLSILLAVLSWLSGPAHLNSQQTASRPFFEARKQQTEFTGPGREDREPEGLTEVRIGYFGPNDAAHPEGGDIWTAVSLAVDEANAEGGYSGLPFRLVPGWADNPWGNGGIQVARMAYEDRVWAVIGGIDGPSTHLAEQVAAKARLPLISPVATDKTVNLANVPWMFSAVPGDHALAPLLASALAAEAEAGTRSLHSLGREGAGAAADPGR